MRARASPESATIPGFFTIFPSIMLPMFLAVVDQTIVATALPAIAAGTGEVERVSWIVVAYLIAATIAAPIYGRLGDAFGRRRLMFFALALFIVASVPARPSPTIEWLTLARVLQGLGGGGLMTLSQALVGETIPPRERARYQGYLATVAVCANTFGPVAGGYLTEHFGWQSIFLVNVPIGLDRHRADLPAEARRRRAAIEWRADPGGLIQFTLFVATTLLALEQAQHVNLSTLPTGGRHVRRRARSRWCCWCGTKTARRRRSFRWPAAHAGDLAQRRHGRLPRRRAGVADHLPAGLSGSGARLYAVGHRPAAGAAHHRRRVPAR